jgi:hypothetical protein
VREQRVDAQAARRAGMAARNARIARARGELAAARRAWIRSDALLAALIAADAAPPKVAGARADRSQALRAVEAAEALLADARAPRARRRRPAVDGQRGSLRAELASITARIEPSDDRRAG